MSIFKFKQFEVNQTNSAMKIGTDAMLFGAIIDSKGKKNGLDIGTGTGVLSLMVAQNNPELQIKAIEIEEAAFHEAKENFNKSTFRNQLEAVHQDFKSFVNEAKFDLIFTNPPYFQNSSKSTSDERNIARHTDTLSLQELAAKIAQLITLDGDVWIVLPLEQMEVFQVHLKKSGFFTNQQFLIYGKKDQPVRQIFTFSKMQKDPIFRELIVRNDDNQYTAEYKNLTMEYHFNKL